AQVAGSAARVAVCRPIVIRGRNRGMIAMRKMPRFRLEPAGVLGVRNADERQRAPQRIDQLLEMSILEEHALGAPRPFRRQLPFREVRRQRRRARIEGSRRARKTWRGWTAGVRGATHRALTL